MYILIKFEYGNHPFLYLGQWYMINHIWIASLSLKMDPFKKVKLFGKLI